MFDMALREVSKKMTASLSGLGGGGGGESSDVDSSRRTFTCNFETQLCQTR